jgi:hypothetical protein
MKKLAACAIAAGAIAGAGVFGPAHAQTSVGVSIGIRQPGVYGRINIGNFPAPELVYAQPVIVRPPAIVVQRAPIYLYVPPAHQQNWSRYCPRYNACGQPVYFVRETWVRERYEHEHPGWQRGGRGKDGHGPKGEKKGGHDNGKHKGRDD